MSLILRRDIRQLKLDAEKVQRGLDMLKRDHAGRAMESKQNGLTQLIEDSKRLECDVSTMLSDCIFLDRQYWKDHNLTLIDSLHQSFINMNTLFNDLKEVKVDPSETHINPSRFHQLVIDWGWLKKSIDQTQRLVQYSQKRRKNHDWLFAVRQSCGDQSGAKSVHPSAGEDLRPASDEPFRKAISIRQMPSQSKGDQAPNK